MPPRDPDINRFREPENPHIRLPRIIKEREHGGIAEAMEKITAERAIRAVWNAEGGPRSSLGLPRTPELSVRKNGTDWEADFRSGKITVKHHGQCHVLTNKVMKVNFVGLECVSRQEGEDEVYGVVGLIGPSNSALKTHSFPGGDGTLSMGERGSRIWTTDQLLYEGPIQDVVVVGTLIEHDDFADVDGVARNLADQIAQKGGQLLGALTGLPAESVTEETWFRDTLAFAFGFVMGDVFGMGDDPYPGQSLRIPWDQVGDFGPPRQPARTRPDDPKQIPRWTHRLTLSARDDAGDFGHYDLFFDVWVDTVSITRECPVPQG